MKTQIRNFMISAGAAVLLSVPVLTAQTKLESAEIPFDFTVGSTSMPAGNYSIDTLTNHAVLVLHSGDANASVIIANGIRGAEKERAVLTFHCYDDRCFLSEVDVPGSSSYVMPRGSRERETAKYEKPTLAYVAMSNR